MPYIAEGQRGAIDKAINRIDWYQRHPGHLNYAITRIIAQSIGPQPSYTAINEAIGVLECAKLELYRRIAAPYEDKKWEENGDVYES